MSLDKQNLKEVDVSQSNRKRLKIIYTGFLTGLAVIALALKPKPILGAERISFSLPVLGDFHISVDSLELFAKEGTIANDLQPYTSRVTYSRR